MALIPVDHAQMEFQTDVAVMAMCVKCPCGNYLFVGRSQESRRTHDAKSWTNLKCPTCPATFTAGMQHVEHRKVPVLLFERGYCSPDSLE